MRLTPHLAMFILNRALPPRNMLPANLQAAICNLQSTAWPRKLQAMGGLFGSLALSCVTETSL